MYIVARMDLDVSKTIKGMVDEKWLLESRYCIKYLEDTLGSFIRCKLAIFLGLSYGT